MYFCTVIEGSVTHVLSTGKDVSVTEGVISNLIVRLVKRMCTPLEDGNLCYYIILICLHNANSGGFILLYRTNVSSCFSLMTLYKMG